MYKKLFKSESNRGFTLIEMLVVLAIMGILSGIIITNLSSAKSKARDARRVSDISHLQLALQMYLDRCGQYPPVDVSGGVGQGGGTYCNRSYSMADFIATIPTPTNEAGQTVYGYYRSGFTYVLYALLEAPNATVMKDSINSGRYPIASITYYCGSNTGTRVLYCVGPN
ncbi:MAG: prepilin-type N-terminal cleavage/methylation domain-containing protein [Candidatus Taylorbacteria bacterium]